MDDNETTAPPRITGAPDAIWLVYGELEHDDTHLAFCRDGEVTWCEDSQYPSDVRYVRADLYEAQAAEIERLSAVSPCGHPASLMLKSAETGADLYCELCDEKSGRRDAESRETEMQAEIERLRAEVADLHGENAVLAGILSDCDNVLATIIADDLDEAEKIGDLRMALAYALDPYKREGTLI